MADKKDNKKQLRQELGYLLNHGVNFTIDVVGYEKKWPWSKPKEIRDTRVMEMHQPTLAVLDLINYYVGYIDIDEEAITKSINPYPQLRRLSKKHLVSVSMAIAVAFLGKRAFVKTRNGYKHDRKEIERMAEMLMANVTPSKLMEMAQAMSMMCNLSDFLNSIRLLQIAPDRIEPTEAD